MVYQACNKYTTGGVVSITLCVYCIWPCQFHPHYFRSTSNKGSCEIITQIWLEDDEALSHGRCHEGGKLNYLFFLSPAVPGKYFVGGTKFTYNEAVLCRKAMKPPRNEAIFCLKTKNIFMPGCVQGAII